MILAFEWNVGTCHSDDMEEIHNADLEELMKMDLEADMDEIDKAWRVGKPER